MGRTEGVATARDCQTTPTKILKSRKISAKRLINNHEKLWHEEAIPSWISYTAFRIENRNFRSFPRYLSTMAPIRPLPCSREFGNASEYVDSLLKFCAASTIFQTLCGGVHILDFFTSEPGLYHTVIPEEWREWLMTRESMVLLDFLMRDDISQVREDGPPESLLKYVEVIRKHSLRRTVSRIESETKLPRHIAVGMIPKKIHEVTNFANYVSDLATSCEKEGKEITHFVDFGSGQNYLGRTLASPPYNKHIIAVESKEDNITGAKSMDVFAGVAEREKVMRNKKLWRQKQDSMTSSWITKGQGGDERVAKPQKAPPADTADLRPSTRILLQFILQRMGRDISSTWSIEFKHGDLSDVVEQIEKMKIGSTIRGIKCDQWNKRGMTEDFPMQPESLTRSPQQRIPAWWQSQFTPAATSLTTVSGPSFLTPAFKQSL